MAITTLTSSDSQFLASLKNLSQIMTRAQQQLASGKRISAPSDDPAQIGVILQDQADLSGVQQTTTNLNRLNTEAQSASTALENSAKLLDQARTLATQGASDTSSAGTRTLLAGQIQAIETQFVGLANSSDSGRYLFAGDADDTAPYSIDFANTPPYVAISTALATRVGIDASGATFPVAMTATEIFNNPDPANNILQSLERLRLALLANDGDSIRSAAGSLGTAANHLGDVQSFYGSVEDRITSALSDASSRALNLQKDLAGLTDADTAQAILDEQTAQTQQQAALAMRAKLPKGSLFDLLG